MLLEYVACNYCGSKELRPYCSARSRYGPEYFQVVKCTGCGLIFVNPRIAGKKEEISNRVVTSIHPSETEIRQTRARCRFVLRKVARYKKAGNFLDVGCGKGFLVREAGVSGWNAYGVELNAGLAGAASAYWQTDRILSSDLKSLTERFGGYFDVINASQVFEHLTDPLETTHELMVLLRNGGILSLDVPNVHSVKYLLRGGGQFDPTAHLYHFSAKTLANLLVKSGLEILEVRTGFASPRLTAKVFSDPDRAAAAAYFLYRLPLYGFGLNIVAVKPL
jgi:2-polyprenyl-3-methyl-5-hydroxy-6-metoxy-1,4-benzoquinol methylase